MATHLQALAFIFGVVVLAGIGYKGQVSSWTAVQRGRRLQESSAADSNNLANDSNSSTEPPCLCVFDIDRTLTGRQNDVTNCPRNKVMTGVPDNAYGSGELTLSALAAEGIDTTFCGTCYLGICSAGDAGGENSEERTVLLEQVLKTPLYEALRQNTPSASWWSWSNDIQSPLVLGSPNRYKQYSVEGIRGWYYHQGIEIPSHNVHFFGDRRENIPPFYHLGFNAREISCESRDHKLYWGTDMVGYCGATPEEIVESEGVINC